MKPGAQCPYTVILPWGRECYPDARSAAGAVPMYGDALILWHGREIARYHNGVEVLYA